MVRAMQVAWEVVAIVALVLLNGFFAGAEIALLSVRKTRLAELAREGKASAAVALRLREVPERLLATVQVGITVVGATAAAVGGSTLQEPLAEVFADLGLGAYSQSLALTVVVGAISALSIVLGELVPKSLALRSSEGFSLLVARPLTAIAVCTRPIAWVLTGASNLLLRPFGDQTTFSESALSASELRQLVEEASSGGAVREVAGDIASRAIDLHSLRLSAVLRPRAQVVTIKLQATDDEVRTILETHVHSRFPVVDGEQEDVVGYVLARDLFLQQMHEGRTDIGRALRKAHFVMESRHSVDALREMQRERSILAIVVNEHGAFEGIVTMEDIAEEFMGEILAEHESPEVRVQAEGEDRFVVLGTTPVRDLNRELRCSLDDGPGYTTIAGLIIHCAGKMVKRGDRVTLQMGITAEVLDATSRQVRVVRLTLPPPPVDETSEGGAG